MLTVHHCSADTFVKPFVKLVHLNSSADIRSNWTDIVKHFNFTLKNIIFTGRLYLLSKLALLWRYSNLTFYNNTYENSIKNF